jgi:hypothetical protein
LILGLAPEALCLRLLRRLREVAYNNVNTPIPVKKASSTVLKELTSVTGGTTFDSKTPAKSADAFEIIGLELRHQYTVEFNSESSSPGAWHSLKFEVKPLQLKDSQTVPLFARSRSGYYSRPL